MTKGRATTWQERMDIVLYYLAKGQSCAGDRRFYLIGFCHTKKDIRTFRISRFLRVDSTIETFDKSDFNIKKYLKNTWSIEQGEKNITFKVRFNAEVARYIKDEELFVHP